MAAQASERMSAALCIGCGRLDAPQLCDEACDEQVLDVVFAEMYDGALAELAAARGGAEPARDLLARLAEEESAGDLRAAARSLLRRIKAESAGGGDAEEVIRVTVEHCRRCGWIEAPQPCLGVCIRKPTEVVPAPAYDEVRGDAERARRQLEELTAVLRQLAWVTPRADAEQRTSSALQSRARAALARSAEPA